MDKDVCGKLFGNVLIVPVGIVTGLLFFKATRPFADSGDMFIACCSLFVLVLLTVIYQCAFTGKRKRH